MNSKVKIARLSVFSNTLLIVMKLVIGLLSGSVSIISEAIHSMMDLLAAIIAFFSVKISDNPPDEEHPYGHGKYENVSGVIEAVLIFVAAIWIIYEAVQKIFHPGKLEGTEIWIGSLIMFISAAINYLVSRKLYRVAKQTDSIALEADALHLKTDVYTSLGVGLGLLSIWITHIAVLDPIIAILVALFILKESYNLLNRAFHPLLDTALPEEEVVHIRKVLDSRNIQYHELKTRKAGSQKFVDFHMEMPSTMPLGEVHRVCDLIEKELEEVLRHIKVNIHVEPLSDSESI